MLVDKISAKMDGIGPLLSQNYKKYSFFGKKNEGSDSVPKFIWFSKRFSIDFGIKICRKIDVYFKIFLLILICTKNAGSAIKLIVSEVFGLSESIQNIVKIDAKS